MLNPSVTAALVISFLTSNALASPLCRDYASLTLVAQVAKCSRYCNVGKACGDGCISKSDNCRQPKGSACDGNPPIASCSIHSKGAVSPSQQARLSVASASTRLTASTYQLYKCQTVFSDTGTDDITWKLIVGTVTLIFATLDEAKKYLNSPSFYCTGSTTA